MTYRWRGRDRYNEADEWERFVRVHAAFLQSGGVYFPGDNTTSPSWLCRTCGAQMAIAVAGREYYYWCRCGTHGGPVDATDYNENRKKTKS